MQKMKPATGHYSAQRTARGNAQVGRLADKSNLVIARELQSTENLMKGKHSKKKFKAAKRLVLKRQGKK